MCIQGLQQPFIILMLLGDQNSLFFNNMATYILSDDQCKKCISIVFTNILSNFSSFNSKFVKIYTLYDWGHIEQYFFQFFSLCTSGQEVVNVRVSKKR